MQSVNQIVSLFQNLQLSHRALNGFGHGELWEVGEVRDTLNYPLLWLRVNNVQKGTNTISYNITLLLMDLVYQDERNETEVHSDMVRIWNGLLDRFRRSEFEFVVDGVSEATLFSERFDDSDAGIEVSMVLRFPTPSDICSEPMNFFLADPYGNYIVTPEGAYIIVPLDL